MATAAYPPGGTFFNTLKRSFTDVPVDASKNNAISTTEFLEASESLVTLFGASFCFPGSLLTATRAMRFTNGLKFSYIVALR